MLVVFITNSDNILRPSDGTRIAVIFCIKLNRFVSQTEILNVNLVEPEIL